MKTPLNYCFTASEYYARHKVKKMQSIIEISQNSDFLSYSATTAVFKNPTFYIFVFIDHVLRAVAPIIG